MYPYRDQVIREARDLALHWDETLAPADFAEFVASVVLGRVYQDLHTRKNLERWEQRIRRDERRRIASLEKGLS